MCCVFEEGKSSFRVFHHPCANAGRIDRGLAERAGAEADVRAITFSEFVAFSLKQTLGEEMDPEYAFAREIAVWLRKNYSVEKFPEDVTLRVFHRIRDFPQWRGNYRELIRGTDGEADCDVRIALHRRIGRLVLRVLDAEVVGRSEALDPEEHIIKSHALLRPRQPPPGVSCNGRER